MKLDPFRALPLRLRTWMLAAAITGSVLRARFLRPRYTRLKLWADTMPRYTRSALKHPLVIIPALVFVLAFGWQQYTYAGRELNLPQAGNLLLNSGFSQFAASGVPTDWHITTTGASDYTVDTADGYVDGRSFKLTVHNYQKGDVILASPKAAVKPGSAYLFKGYYNADAPFALLVRIYYADGSNSLKFIQTYRTTSGTWSTTSDAFKAEPGTVAVQFIYRMYTNGSLELNSLYLEPRQHVYIAPEPGGYNMIPNSQLTSGSSDTPASWSTYDTGTNEAAFSYLQAGSQHGYLQARVSSYESGEAKWQYPPQLVQAHDYYLFSVTYRSDTPVPIVAEYVLEDGTRQYQTVADLSPAGGWTNVSYKFEVPEGATTMFVSLPLKHNGTVSTRGYQLMLVSRPGPVSWQQAVVSLTFDSGRQSQYQNAYPLLHRNGYEATFYINPATIETPGFMTADDLTALAGGGNEIGARGYNPDDMTTINENALAYQLQKGRDYLRDAGFQVTDFAVPFGRSDSEVQYYARQDYTTLRGTETGTNTRQSLDPYNLKVLNISSATTLQSLTSALQNAQAEHGWLILVYQDVGTDTTDSSTAATKSAITAEVFKQQMELVRQSGITVMPVAAAYTALQQE